MNYIEYLEKWFEEHYDEKGMLKDKYEWKGWRLKEK